MYIILYMKNVLIFRKIIILFDKIILLFSQVHFIFTIIFLLRNSTAVFSFKDFYLVQHKLCLK